MLYIKVSSQDSVHGLYSESLGIRNVFKSSNFIRGLRRFLDFPTKLVQVYNG